MARHSRYTRTRSRTRNVRPGAERLHPWVLLSQATDIVRDRPLDLSPEDRGRLRALVIQAGGRGINLSPRERAEAARLVERAGAPAKRLVPVPLVAKRRAR